MEKKVLKQDIPRKDDGHIELAFRVRFYPVDVTQVLQYVTLYQTFLSSRLVRRARNPSNVTALFFFIGYFQCSHWGWFSFPSF